MELFKLLKKNKMLAMHMPGHKRNAKDFPYLKGIAKYDITEIEGFDNLHNPSGILKESMEMAAELRGADRCFYLVNGSTCGILASIAAVIEKGDKVIVARNSHKSVYNALEIVGANSIYIMPEMSKGGILKEISPETVLEKIKENPDAKLVVVTSPTYEGVVSDIAEISRIAHESGIPVLVDAAHGAHFGYGYGFSQNATRLQADIVVESLHKTLASLTQTALLSVRGNIVDSDKIAKKLAIFETSSPSYILMASIDSCLYNIKQKGNKIFSRWQKNLDFFYDKTRDLKNLEILSGNEFFGFDRSKIVVLTKSGEELFRKLRENGIEPEMVLASYVVLMTGVGDTKQSLSKLAKVLVKIDKTMKKAEKLGTYIYDLPRREFLHCETLEKEAEWVDFKEASGRISKEYIWVYPPGVPIIVPGEIFSEGVIELLKNYEESQIKLAGGAKSGRVLVIK